MNSLAGIDMGRILLDLSNEVIKQLDEKNQCSWHLARV